MLDPAAVQHGDPIGHGQRLLLVMCDEDKADTKIMLQGLQFQLHGLAQVPVECRERLVEKQELGLVDDCTRQSHSLALAARELVRAAALVTAKVQPFQCFADTRVALARATPATSSP